MINDTSGRFYKGLKRVWTVTPRVHVTKSARIISTHSHSRRLIILLATRLSSFVVFPRSAGSLPSNIARRMSTTFLKQYEQRSLKDELKRVIRSGGPLPTIQVQSQTSSGSRPRPPPLSSAPASKRTLHCTTPAQAVVRPMPGLSLPVFQFPGWSSSQGGGDLKFLCPRTFSRIIFEESFEPTG